MGAGDCCNWTHWALFSVLLPKNPSYIIWNGHKMETELLSYSSDGTTPILPTPPRANGSFQFCSLLKSSFSGVQVPKRGCGVGWRRKRQTHTGGFSCSLSLYSILTTLSQHQSPRSHFYFLIKCSGRKEKLQNSLIWNNTLGECLSNQA